MKYTTKLYIERVSDLSKNKRINFSVDFKMSANKYKDEISEKNQMY